MSVSAATVMVKGQPIKSLLKFIDGELSPDQRQNAFASVPPEFAERLRSQQILATEFVPVAVLNRLTEEAAKAKGEPVDAFARRAGRAAATEALSGIYRVFAMVLTPPALLSKASTIWSSLYNAGRMHVESESKTAARVKLEDFPSETTGCARVTGWMERMIELTGEKTTRVTHIHCYARGTGACEWEIRWGKDLVRSSMPD